MKEPALKAPVGAFSIPEFAQTYRLGRSTVYELIDSGELKSFHVGRRRLVSFAAAQEWQQKLEAISAAAREKDCPPRAHASAPA